MDLQLVSLVIGSTGAVLGIIEKRMYDMRESFKEQLLDKNEINKTIQSNIQEDIKEIKDKLDMLIRRQFRGLDDENR